MHRNPALDGARALAVMLVLLHHTHAPGFGGGFIGVDIFFVLSGYLITGILLREADATGDIVVRRFVLQRALRIIPPFALLVLAVLGFLALTSSDYAGTLGGGFILLSHTWSLAVEEMFYLLWPLAVIGLVRLTPADRRKFVAIAIVVATLWRITNAAYLEDFSMTARRFDTRLSGLLVGAWLAFAGIKIRPQAAIAIGVLSLTALAALTLIATQDAMKMALLQPFIDLASAGLVVALLLPNTGLSRAFSLRPFAWMGLISYSVYLWHYPISMIAGMYLDDWRIVLPMTFILSMPISALSYAFVEKPLQSWRQKRLATGWS